MRTVCVVALGGRFLLAASDDETLRRLLGAIPEGWSVHSEAPPGAPLERFELERDGGHCLIRSADGVERIVADVDLAVRLLVRRIQVVAAANAADTVPIRGGAVRVRGRAILLPGGPFAGTTTLIRALTGAGAEPLADGVVLIDADGRIAAAHEPGESASAGGATEVGLVALTQYRPGGSWDAARPTAGEGLVALMGCFAGRRQGARTLATLHRALARAAVLIGERGEAEVAAPALLQEFDASVA